MATHNMRPILLSHTISEKTPLYPGTRRVRIGTQQSFAKGDTCHTSTVSLSTHTATHIDFPAHFLKQGKTFSAYADEQWLFTRCGMVELNLSPGASLTCGMLKCFPNDRSLELLLIKFGWERHRGTRRYHADAPLIPAACVHWLRVRYPRLRAIGFDMLSVSSLRDREEGRRAHRAFLSRNILLIEDMHLAQLYSTPDHVLVSPLLLKGAEAAPVAVWAFFQTKPIAAYDYFFFDFDGVILDSMGVKTRAFYDMYRPYGKKIAEKVAAHHEYHGGMSRFLKFAHYHKTFLGKTLSTTEVDKKAFEFADRVYEQVMKAPFIKGVEAFLAWTKKERKTCFVVTGTPEEEITTIIKRKKLQRYFKAIKGAPADKTKNIRSLIKQYGIPRERAVFFGDAINDIQAANECAIPFIGISYNACEQRYNNFLPLNKQIGVL